MITLIIYSFIVGSVAFTISTTGIFEGFREHVSMISSKLGEMFRCPWCIGHWITFFFLGITGYSYEFIPFRDSYVLTGINFMMTAFAIPGMSAPTFFILLRAFKPVTEREMDRQMKLAKQKQKEI